jgi:ATP-dependent DNA ligase
MPPPWRAPHCALPPSRPQPPSGELWPHEIKHDDFRIIARKDSERARLYSRPGNDLTRRFPLIVQALARLRSRSCINDGEAVCILTIASATATTMPGCSCTPST